jgi:hypothetical protein
MMPFRTGATAVLLSAGVLMVLNPRFSVVTASRMQDALALRHGKIEMSKRAAAFLPKA